MQLLTTKQVVVRIAVVISVAEFLIMLALGGLPYPVNPYLEAVIDVISLVVLSTPTIYIWVIKPFVTARDEALSQISDLAHLDSLTQLANRRLILKHLERMLASNVRHKMYGALLLLDLDGFKPINDAHGHDGGDVVLMEIAKRIQSITRTEDVVGRLGGDEFVVLLNHLDGDARSARDKAAQIAKKMIELVNKPFDFNGKHLHVGASMGVRLLGFEAVEMEKVISQADSAMYRAKQAGKGCAVFYGE